MQRLGLFSTCRCQNHGVKELENIRTFNWMRRSRNWSVCGPAIVAKGKLARGPDTAASLLFRIFRPLSIPYTLVPRILYMFQGGTQTKSPTQNLPVNCLYPFALHSLNEDVAVDSLRCPRYSSSPVLQGDSSITISS